MVVLIGLMKLSATIKDDNKVTSLSFQTSISMKQFIVLCLVAFVLPACHKGKIKRKACSYPLTQTQFGSGYLSIPNIFTPDGDEYNENWKPVFHSGYDPYDYHLTIFNRWGEIVFESYDTNYGWDGSYSDEGLTRDNVYVWKIEFKETSSDKKHRQAGHVTLLK